MENFSHRGGGDHYIMEKDKSGVSIDVTRPWSHKKGPNLGVCLVLDDSLLFGVEAQSGNL